MLAPLKWLLSYTDLKINTKEEEFLDSEKKLHEQVLPDKDEPPKCERFLDHFFRFLKELLLDESFYIKVHIYDYDAKRVHLFLTMYNSNDERNATYEAIMMGVGNETRRSMDFPKPIQEKIKHYFDQQNTFDVPKQLGHVIGIPKK